MTDIVDQQTRCRTMLGIRGKNTKPELALRRALHARGFRFRRHSGKVHGRPELILPKHRAVVFLHGCIWHRHKGCRYATAPAIRPKFWRAKFETNAVRDSAVRTRLLEDGPRVATVWECALRMPEQVEASTESLSIWLRTEEFQIENGDDNSLRYFSTLRQHLVCLGRAIADFVTSIRYCLPRDPPR